MMGNPLSAPVLVFHLCLQTTNTAGLLHMGHCARDCGNTRLPKGCYKQHLVGTSERGPASALSELASAPSVSSQKPPPSEGSTPDLPGGERELEVLPRIFFSGQSPRLGASVTDPLFSPLRALLAVYFLIGCLLISTVMVAIYCTTLLIRCLYLNNIVSHRTALLPGCVCVCVCVCVCMCVCVRPVGAVCFHLLQWLLSSSRPLNRILPRVESSCPSLYYIALDHRY